MGRGHRKVQTAGNSPPVWTKHPYKNMGESYIPHEQDSDLYGWQQVRGRGSQWWVLPTTRTTRSTSWNHGHSVDGGITGMKMGLKAAGDKADKVIILSDSKAAIQAVINAGSRGKARTRDLVPLGNEICSRQSLYGPDNVAVGWVKAHVGINRNERADEMAKMGAAKEGRNHITEGGLRQWEKARRRDNRVKGGHVDVTKWDRHTASTYTQLRTNSGNLASWRKMIG